MTKQEKIKNRIRSIRELDEVTVKVSKSLGTIDVTHDYDHVANFKFKWVSDNHYVGYFVNLYGEESQAIVSLWEPIEAVKFIVLYTTLVELRAKR